MNAKAITNALASAKPNAGTVRRFIAAAMANGSLFVVNTAAFDGSEDGVRKTGYSELEPAVPSEQFGKYGCGVAGVFLVNTAGRNYVSKFEKDGFRGFQVDNYCGSFTVAVKI